MKTMCSRCLYLITLSVYDPMSYGLPDSAEYNRLKFKEIEENLEKLGPPHSLADCKGDPKQEIGLA